MGRSLFISIPACAVGFGQFSVERSEQSGRRVRVRYPKACNQLPIPYVEDHISDTASPLPHMLPSAAQFAAACDALGRPAQVDPIEPMLKAPKPKRLKLKHDVLLSSVGFNFNLRRYTLVSPTTTR
jgi:hypothetical protein